MNVYRRLAFLAGALLLVLTIGTVGYWLIEDWGFLDSLFMTVVTVSTVGYSEVHPLSDAGRVFSIFLIIGGVGLVFYTITSAAEYVVESRLRDTIGGRRMKNRIAKLKDHIILCGYGRVGREVARTLSDEKAAFVVIDTEAQAVAQADAEGYIALQGDADRDEVLKDAGIERARALIAALGSDAQNVYVTLSAKAARPELFVVARGSDEESEEKLRRAGADRTMLPLNVSGRRMAMLAMHPLVVDLVEHTMHSRDRNLVLEDIKITSTSPIKDMTIKDSQRHTGGMFMLAIKKKGGKLIANPPSDTVLETGDELVAIATPEQVQYLKKRSRSRSSK